MIPRHSRDCGLEAYCKLPAYSTSYRLEACSTVPAVLPIPQPVDFPALPLGRAALALFPELGALPHYPVYPVHLRTGRAQVFKHACPDLDFLPAAVVAGRIISKTMQSICLDLGYKSIASEMKHPRLQFLDLEYDEVLNHSEEHLVLSTEEAGHRNIGEVVYALPSHICPTMALHEEVYVVRMQKVTETWKVVARKRMYPL